jgi:ribosomal protein S18 acetylase RimI-like enzyme
LKILLLRKDYITFVHIYQLSTTTRDIIVRKARVEDAEIIARAVEMAIDNEEAVRDYCGDDYIAVLQEIARRKATQYSWTQALVAEVDGVAAGAVVGYDGAQLAKLREGTFEVLMECVGRIPRIDDETEAGEYYLDSVAVLPEFRGMGVGRALVSAFCDRAFAMGHSCVGLIVDYGNPNAEKLYTSLGFQRVGHKKFLGHDMHHLQLTTTTICTTCN